MTKIITYSPSLTLVSTYECYNQCTYCNFRVDLGKGEQLSLTKAREMLLKWSNKKITEILILSGEVHLLSAQRKKWFDHIYDLCCLVLEMGFLPHTNVGILHYAEMEKLKEVNASMGLMLEQVTPKLLEGVHRYAPSKIPKVRTQQLKYAGELKIPFTTGLLLGIGEMESDWWDTLEVIHSLHLQYRHIQEVILQPYSTGDKEILKHDSFDIYKLPEIIVKAREILHPDIVIQIPPNLVSQPQLLLDCLDAGARDLGGINPKDEVNPNYPHLQLDSLQEILSQGGWELQPRLPFYPHHYSWLSSPIQNIVKNYNNSCHVSTNGLK